MRAAAFGVLGVGSALVALVFRRFIPPDFPAKIGADAVDGILQILASSMLAVTTFSLSVMVSVLGQSTQNTTPRATQLLEQDSTTQNALATFIGSFIFSLVGLIAINAGVYGGSGRVILFAVTLFVVALIVVTMVRWTDYLTDFGRVGETTGRVERAARESLAERQRHPALGGTPLPHAHPIPAHAEALFSDHVGYVQHIDIARLGNLISRDGTCDLYVAASPGSFVHPGAPLGHLTGEITPDKRKAIAGAWTIGTSRSFDQDPRFGLIVLAEIASRALSPGINDPGTAIDVIGRLVRLLVQYVSPASDDKGSSGEPLAHVHVPTLAFADLVDDAFGPVARHGAGNPAVQIRLQKALSALAMAGSAELRSAALSQSQRALRRSRHAGLPEDELEDIEAAALATGAPEAGEPRRQNSA